MLLDLTVPLTPEMVRDAFENGNPALRGHLGTHFDVMDQEFPLEYTRRRGQVMDVRGAGEEIGLEDVDMERIKEGMFVVFCTGWLESRGYGSPAYFHRPPQLSQDLIQALAERRVSLIGLDLPGLRRGEEHAPADEFCARQGMFVVENLWGLSRLLEEQPEGRFEAGVYPLRCSGLTGLPCRVVARDL
jgi:kynurenine formamidase